MQSETQQQILLLTPDSAIDSTGAAEMLEQTRLAMDDGLRHVILDLHAAPYLCAAGLDALLDIGSMLQRVGGHIAVTGASEQAHALLHTSGVSHLLLQFDSSADAQRHLQQLQTHDADDDEDEDDEEEYEDESAFDDE
jgi:anti-anti-sigma factor